MPQRDGLNSAPVVPGDASLIEQIEHARGGLSRKPASIAEFIQSDPTRFIKMTAKELCVAIGTSEPTLIKFCQGFGYSGLSEFRIDLAVELATRAVPMAMIEPSGSDRRNVNASAKAAIAEAALPLLEEDRTILMDNGSTVEQLAHRMGDHSGLTVMTSGLGVAQEVLAATQHTVILTGGEIRRASMSMGGRLVEMMIREMRFDTAYIGTDSLDPKTGLSTFLEEEAHQTRAMVFASRRLIVLADQSKFNTPNLHWICGTEKIHTLVTDAPRTHPTVVTLLEKGVKVVSTQDATT